MILNFRNSVDQKKKLGKPFRTGKFIGKYHMHAVRLNGDGNGVK